MRFPVDRYEEDWYLADTFGTNRGTYYHSGVDVNLSTGGNTDYGAKIYAIADGKLVYYHVGSHSTKGFGIHNVYRIETPFGTRWVHQAHMQEKDVLRTIQDVREGDVVGLVGSTGNSTSAHIHFSIFKVDPSSLPNGIDTIAKTRTQLNDWFEAPIEFIKKVMEASMPDLPPDFGDTVWKSTQHDETVHYIWGNDVNPRQKSSKDIQQYIGGLKSQITTLQNRLAVSEAEVSNRVEQVGRLEADIANKERQIKDLSTAYNSIVQEINGLRVSCEADKKVMQESIDNCSKEKGQLEKDKAELKAENERLKKEVGTPLAWHEHLVLAIRKLLGVL